jgi:hypothetical protein
MIHVVEQLPNLFTALHLETCFRHGENYIRS